jgi:putative proteasome-type protease
MTYCVGLTLDRGIVMMSDTRTNAGVDNVSVFKKMTTWQVPGERVITMMSSGNLATTQSVVSLLDERTKAPSERNPSILEAPSMFQIATIVGRTLRKVIRRTNGDGSDGGFRATLIIGGQIAGSEPRLFKIYAEGNFIEAGEDTPFFQTGETKYGRPIIVRAYDPAMSFEEAIKLLLVSFDSTIKANLSVGLPLDVTVYARDSLRVTHEFRITQEDEYFNIVTNGWGNALKVAFSSLPDFTFDTPAEDAP